MIASTAVFDVSGAERYKTGDVNLDGRVSILDATEIQKYLSEIVDLTDTQKAVADTNHDGKLNILDATEVQKYLSELIDTLEQDSASGLLDDKYFGDEGTADNPITLKVWTPDAAVNLVRRQVENFKKSYPDRKFSNIEVIACGEGDAYIEILNDPYVAADVFCFSSDQLNKLVAAEVISPVIFSDLVKSANDEQSVKSATYTDSYTGEENLYAYPETNDNGYYLVYDKSVVSDNQAKTLEGVLEACKKSGKKFIMDAENGFYSCAFAFTAGVQIDGFEDDEITQKFVDYDEDEAVAVIQAFGRLIKKYQGTFQSLDVSNIPTGFSQGTVGAGFDGVWDTAYNRDALGSRFGAAKLPTINVNGTDKPIVPMQGFKFIGVNSTSEFPMASQMLAYYLTSEECQYQLTDTLGWGPTNINVQNDDVVKTNPVINAMVEQSVYACPQVNVSSTFWSPMGFLGYVLCDDEFDPEDELFISYLIDFIVTNVRDEYDWEDDYDDDYEYEDEYYYNY